MTVSQFVTNYVHPFGTTSHFLMFLSEPTQLCRLVARTLKNELLDMENTVGLCSFSCSSTEWKRLTCTRGGSVAKWLRAGLRRSRARVQIAVATLSGNSLIGKLLTPIVLLLTKQRNW